MCHSDDVVLFFFGSFRPRRCETNGASSVGSARPAESQMSKTILHWTLGSKYRYLFFQIMCQQWWKNPNTQTPSERFFVSEETHVSRGSDPGIDDLKAQGGDWSYHQFNGTAWSWWIEEMITGQLFFVWYVAQCSQFKREGRFRRYLHLSLSNIWRGYTSPLSQIWSTSQV